MVNENAYHFIVGQLVKAHWITDETITDTVIAEIAVTARKPAAIVHADMKAYAKRESMIVRFYR